VRLVVFTGGELAGTITLRERALQALPEYQPGLGGLFVAERRRGRGIGAALIRAGMNVAQDLGYERVYTATVTARGILERLDWQLCQAVTHGDGQLLLYCYEFIGMVHDNFTNLTADRGRQTVICLWRGGLRSAVCRRNCKASFPEGSEPCQFID
jgi:GNAT superfamily N-acetyltransferase